MKMDGLGILRVKGLLKYEGGFKEGKIHGFGKMYYKDDVVIANFVNGVPEGMGCALQEDELSIGFYKNGRI
jgi:hypothetical protein